MQEDYIHIADFSPQSHGRVLSPRYTRLCPLPGELLCNSVVIAASKTTLSCFELATFLISHFSLKKVRPAGVALSLL